MTFAALHAAALALLLVFVAGLFLYALWTDFRSMRIPNEVSLLLLGAYAVRWAVAPSTCSLLDFAYGGAVFAFGLAVYFLLRVGGGDVKLFSAGALWFGAAPASAGLFALLGRGVVAPVMPTSVYFILLMAIVGILPAAMAIAVRSQNWAMAALAVLAPHTARLMGRSRAFPYAAAIAPAALYILFVQAKAWGVVP